MTRQLNPDKREATPYILQGTKLVVFTVLKTRLKLTNIQYKYHINTFSRSHLSCRNLLYMIRKHPITEDVWKINSIRSGLCSLLCKRTFLRNDFFKLIHPLGFCSDHIIIDHIYYYWSYYWSYLLTCVWTIIVCYMKYEGPTFTGCRLDSYITNHDAQIFLLNLKAFIFVWYQFFMVLLVYVATPGPGLFYLWYVKITVHHFTR